MLGFDGFVDKRYDICAVWERVERFSVLYLVKLIASILLTSVADVVKGDSSCRTILCAYENLKTTPTLIEEG